MDDDTRYNSNPLSQSARSLFSQMIARVHMSEFRRNMIVAATIGITDDDIATMVEKAHLCRTEREGEP